MVNQGNTFYTFILYLATMHKIFCHSIHCNNLLLFYGNQHNAIGAPPTSWKQKNSLISCIIGPIYGKTTINSLKKVQFIADLVHHDKNRCCVVFEVQQRHIFEVPENVLNFFL